jgi:hypothetical protein
LTSLLYFFLFTPAKETGKFFIDEHVLLKHNMTVTEINAKYNNNPEEKNLPDDFFLGKPLMSFTQLNKRNKAAKL